jgi:hypothetical protein
VYPKVSGLNHNEINKKKKKNKHSLRRNTKGYGDKTRWNVSNNSDTTAPSGRELYHLQFSLQAVIPKTFGYTFVRLHVFCSMTLDWNKLHIQSPLPEGSHLKCEVRKCFTDNREANARNLSSLYNSC